MRRVDQRPESATPVECAVVRSASSAWPRSPESAAVLEVPERIRSILVSSVSSIRTVTVGPGSLHRISRLRGSRAAACRRHECRLARVHRQLRNCTFPETCLSMYTPAMRYAQPAFRFRLAIRNAACARRDSGHVTMTAGRADRPCLSVPTPPDAVPSVNWRASLFFFSCSFRMRSSMVSLATIWYTFTSWVWPIRCARSVAWFCAAAFHQWIGVHHHGCAHEVQARVAGFERDEEYGHVIAVEFVDQFHTAFLRRLAGDGVVFHALFGESGTEQV